MDKFIDWILDTRLGKLTSFLISLVVSVTLVGGLMYLFAMAMRLPV